MKHIKSYRVFENDSISTIELYNLGLIELSDIGTIITDDTEAVDFINDLFDLGYTVNHPVNLEFIQNMGFDQTLALSIWKKWYSANTLRIEKYIAEFPDLIKTDADISIVWVTEQDRVPVFSYFKGDHEFVFANREIFTNTLKKFGLNPSAIAHLIKTIISGYYNIGNRQVLEVSQRAIRIE